MQSSIKITAARHGQLPINVPCHSIMCAAISVAKHGACVMVSLDYQQPLTADSTQGLHQGNKSQFSSQATAININLAW